jgi:mono/diheme cytochrome c family protein
MPGSDDAFKLEDRFMRRNSVTVVACLPLVLTVMTFLGTGIAAGQTASTATVSGSELFYNNCAACHGVGGKGDGPMGQVLTIRPADLTILAKKTGGKFPATQIYQMIDGRNPAVRGHGGPDMPVWGEVFAAKGNAASVKDRVNALVKHIETLQVK